MSGFKYDIVRFIELIESKPCIWDKTNENYKNKILRDISWQEIIQNLEDGYEQLSHAEKKKTGEIIINRWSHIRDAFIRSLRTKSGQGAKKKYLYNEHLQFLLKTTEKDETESNYSHVETENDNIKAEEFTESQQPTPPSSQYSTTRSISKRQLDDLEPEILLDIKKGKQSVEAYSDNPHHLRSDKELLLLSFMPYVRDMSEMELLDFQMEVLTTIKNIKQRRDTF